MAKILLSAIGITAISGKSGGSVFAFNKGGKYVRSWAKPTNPQTDKQTALRSIFSFVTKKWGSLTEAQVKAWKDYAKTNYKTDVFGESKPMTGFSSFVQANQNRLHSGFNDILLVPMKRMAMPSFRIFGSPLIDTADASDIVLHYPETFANGDFVLSIGVCAVPENRKVDFGSVKTKFGNRLRVPAVATALGSGLFSQTIDLTALVAELGIQKGQTVYFQIHMHSADGQKSNEVTAKTIAVEL